MSDALELTSTLERVGEVEIELRSAGTGAPPVLLLPGLFDLEADPGLVSALIEQHTVYIPIHPGFGATTRPTWFNSVADLAELYIDLVEAKGLENVILTGCSFGGWVAAEIAVRRPAWLAHLLLVGSLGIRVGGREDRDIIDVFATPFAELRSLMFSDHDTAERLLGTEGRPREELLRLAQAQEAVAVYGWEPYLHDSKLARRLARVNVPATVIWGSEDRIASPAYGKAFADAIPGARFREVAQAGHLPHLEQPRQFIAAVAP